MDTYFERGYKGKLNVYIEDDLSVTWAGRLRIRVSDRFPHHPAPVWSEGGAE